MPFSVPFFRWFCAAVLALTLAAAAPGQISPGTGAGGEADIDALEARRAAAEADTTLPAEVQARVVELFARAIDERGRAATLIAETSALNSRLETAPDRIRALEAEVAGGATEPTPGEYEELTLQALDRRVQDKQQALQSARDELKAAERELVGLTAQGPVMSEEIAKRKRALRDLEDDIAQPVPGELPISADAREVYVLARKARLEAEIAKAEVQLANYEQLVRLATLERDAAVVRVSGLDAEREVLTAALEARRAREAREGRRQAQDTEAATSALPDAVASLAIENAELRRELEEITVQTARVAEQLRGVERRSSALDADLESLQERVATVGSTQAVGRLLWRRLESLGDLEAAPTPAVSRTRFARRTGASIWASAGGSSPRSSLASTRSSLRCRRRSASASGTPCCASRRRHWSLLRATPSTRFTRPTAVT